MENPKRGKGILASAPPPTAAKTRGTPGSPGPWNLRTTSGCGPRLFPPVSAYPILKAHHAYLKA